MLEAHVLLPKGGRRPSIKKSFPYNLIYVKKKPEEDNMRNT
jgi:hypothetical protein